MTKVFGDIAVAS